MSSADFDDKPQLASGILQLSEADEAEFTKSDSVTKGQDELEDKSPPTTGKILDKPKFKTLFKRSTNSSKSNGSSKKSKSLNSSNGSHDDQCRVRHGTCSTLTPDTSLEQATCVEKGSTSFEDELFRHNHVDSASDSEDSAETGGSLTHHRYYHVFREGEIDHTIEKYVDNLHVISSYYDHANWCIIAEKVNVWSI